jgi:hypothetical protein
LGSQPPSNRDHGVVVDVHIGWSEGGVGVVDSVSYGGTP